MRISPKLLSAFLVAWIAPASAMAQQANPNCPPGSWFCEESSPPASALPPPALPPPAVAPPPAAATPPENLAPPATTVIVPGNRQGPPPVIIYQQAPPPPPPVYVIQRPPPRVVMPPPPPPRPAWRRWGLNLRLQGVMMDDRKQETASMGGAGISLRARPVPHFALDFGLDAIGGKDYNGNSRSEMPFTINAMVFVNPRSPVQFYMLGGIGWSAARVEYDSTPSPMTGGSTVRSPYEVERYSYFGGQIGAGLEFRVSQPVSLNLDLIGFVRGRTDRNARDYPEFTDENGRTTNTSGGGLARAGITFYW